MVNIYTCTLTLPQLWVRSLVYAVLCLWTHMCEVWDACLCRCMRYCICVCKRERKQAILLRSNSLLCISDAPLSHDSHEVSAAAPAVSFGPAARPGPSHLSRVLSSLSEFSSLSSNYLKMQYTWSLWCCRDRHTVWAVVEKMEERDREGGNTRVDAADEKTITQLYHKLVLGSWSCSQSQIHSISDMFVLLYPDCYCR